MYQSAASGKAGRSVLFQNGQSACMYYFYGKRADMAIEKMITEEAKKNAIDLLITMTVDELSEYTL